ncbi:thioredoxin domain-containing protein, partial [Achromobacter sp. Marseille-Q0513]|uniref:DsbA family protein n=1 Tax=Achromobacter sp. Marseille-Q0513 TaxID=2829161 RepID=UPI001B9F9F47
RRLRSWRWGLAAVLLALLLIWLASSPREVSIPPAAPGSAAPGAEPPWQTGNREGRFVLTLYADFECPFCQAYYPVLRRWVTGNTDVALQWQHLPLAAHQPAASVAASLAECAAEVGGSEVFWRATDWIYTHTRGNGLG